MDGLNLLIAAVLAVPVGLIVLFVMHFVLRSRVKDLEAKLKALEEGQAAATISDAAIRAPQPAAVEIRDAVEATDAPPPLPADEIKIDKAPTDPEPVEPAAAEPETPAIAASSIPPVERKEPPLQPRY